MVRAELLAIRNRVTKLLEHLEGDKKGYTWAVRAVLQDQPGPFAARPLYRLLKSRTGLSQRDLPGHLSALGYRREKKEAGVFWAKPVNEPASKL